MSNGSDNRSGKPPAAPGARPGVPTITPSQPAAPVVQRPATVPITSTQPAATGFPSAPGIRPATPAAAPRPPTAAPGVAGIARPPSAAPGVMPARPPSAAVPAIAPAVAPARPPSGSAPSIPPVAARPATGGVPPVAPAVPRSPSGVPGVAPVQARPAGSPSGVIAPPVAPAAARPGTGSNAVLVPPVAAARPAVAPPGYPSARPVSSPSGFIAMPPQAAPAARPASAPSGVIAVPPQAPRPASAPSGVIAPPPPGAPARPAVGLGAPAATAAPARQGPLPESGAIETITPQQAAALKKMANAIDSFDYFQALGVAQQASPGEIKKAFYRESRTYHPDRFFHLPDSEVKTDIGTIYKRLTEAYFVLRDDAKRKKYLSDITSAERTSKLRYTEATESEQKAEARKAVEEEFGNHPKSRPLFKAALADIEKQNWAQAERNLKSGLMYDPGNTRFKEKLAEVQKKVEEQRKSSSSGYMIK